MVQYPRHAVVEFHLDWAVKSWHCVLCSHVTNTELLIVQHLQNHVIKKVSSTVVTSGLADDFQMISYSGMFHGTSEDVHVPVHVNGMLNYEFHNVVNIFQIITKSRLTTVHV